MIRDVLDIQKQAHDNEANKVRLRELEIKENAKLAHQSLKIQGDFLSKRPLEYRKTFNTYIIGFGGLGVLFLGFIFLCLHFGHTDFIIKFIQIISYIVTTVIGYIFGKRSSKPRERNEVIEDAEVLD